MNKKALEYAAYKAILEADITAEQKQRLIEIGIFQKVAAFLGAGKETVGAMKGLFNDKRYAKQSAMAIKNIEKELESIMDAAEKATGSREVVYDVLKAILEKKGMEPGKVSTGSGTSSSEASSDASNKVTPGQSVSVSSAADNEQLLQQILQAVAELKGMSADKAAEKAAQVAKKEPSQDQVFGEIVKAVSSVSGVSNDKVQKVYKWLEDNGHVVVGEVMKESILKRAKLLMSSRTSRGLS